MLFSYYSKFPPYERHFSMFRGENCQNIKTCSNGVHRAEDNKKTSQRHLLWCFIRLEVDLLDAWFPCGNTLAGIRSLWSRVRSPRISNPYGVNGRMVFERDQGWLPFERKIRLGCWKHDGKRLTNLPHNCNIRCGLNAKKGEFVCSVSLEPRRNREIDKW